MRHLFVCAAATLPHSENCRDACAQWMTRSQRSCEVLDFLPVARTCHGARGSFCYGALEPHSILMARLSRHIYQVFEHGDCVLSDYDGDIPNLRRMTKQASAVVVILSEGAPQSIES
eukprot:6452322-Amphidinium_carterae.1